MLYFLKNSGLVRWARCFSTRDQRSWRVCVQSLFIVLCASTQRWGHLKMGVGSVMSWLMYWTTLLKRGSCGSEGRGALLIYIGLLGDNRLCRVWETLPRFLGEVGVVSECEWSEEMRVLMSDRIEFVGQLALGLEAMLG